MGWSLAKRRGKFSRKRDGVRLKERWGSTKRERKLSQKREGDAERGARKGIGRR